MKVALVYDRVNKWGGAERVLLALHTLFPQAPLYTSVYNPQTASWAKGFNIKTSFLQSFPFAKRAHELYAPLMPLAFESFNFDEYDLVISITSEAAKGIVTKSSTQHICYMLTPTRYLWSGYKEYFSSPFLKFLTLPLIWYLRKWDIVASSRPDKLIAISGEVAERIKKYYKRDADVVYPPLTLASSGKGKGERGKNVKKTTKPYTLNPIPYFLVVSRLVPYKRIDLAIKACNRGKFNLKIVGLGSEEQNLREIAGETIEFVGRLTDTELIDYYRNSLALLFPGNEDFGLVMLESQAMGKPVIAYGKGGALETVIPGITGELFFPQTVASLYEKLEKFNNLAYNSRDCQKNAQKFGLVAFKKRFLKGLEKTNL